MKISYYTNANDYEFVHTFQNFVHCKKDEKGSEKFITSKEKRYIFHDKYCVQISQVGAHVHLYYYIVCMNDCTS